MEREEREKLLAALRAKSGEETRIIVSPKLPPEKDGESVRAAAFTTRAELRMAQLAQQKARVEPALDELAAMIDTLGLSVVPVYTANALIVTGNADRLEGVLDLPSVETAKVDFDIELIAPESEQDDGKE